MKYRNFLLFPFRNFSVFSKFPLKKFRNSAKIETRARARRHRSKTINQKACGSARSLTIVQTRAQNQSLRAGVRHLGNPFFGDPKELYQKFRHPDHGHQGCGPRRAWPPWSSRCGRWAAGCRKYGAGATSAKQEIPKGPSGHRGERAKVPAKFIHTFVRSWVWAKKSRLSSRLAQARATKLWWTRVWPPSAVRPPSSAAARVASESSRCRLWRSPGSPVKPATIRGTRSPCAAATSPTRAKGSRHLRVG